MCDLVTNPIVPLTDTEAANRTSKETSSYQPPSNKQFYTIEQNVLKLGSELI